MKCSVFGCGKKHNARGYCKSHYDSAYRTGELSIIQPKGLPLKTRLLERSKASGGNGCIEWTGSIDSDGYGSILVDGKLIGAHRAAWEVANGTIPNGMCVLHHCDNPPCINSEHLFLGTQTDNVADMVRKKRIPSRQGELNNGAKLTEDIVKRIRADVRPSKQIAADYGLHRNAVWLIKSRRTWNHIS